MQPSIPQAKHTAFRLCCQKCSDVCISNDAFGCSLPHAAHGIRSHPLQMSFRVPLRLRKSSSEHTCSQALHCCVLDLRLSALACGPALGARPFLWHFEQTTFCLCEKKLWGVLWLKRLWSRGPQYVHSTGSQDLQRVRCGRNCLDTSHCLHLLHSCTPLQTLHTCLLSRCQCRSVCASK